MTVVRLACGHTGRANDAHRVGEWVSCWALMHPERGCQGQRKIVSVTPCETGWQQGGLW